MTPADERMMALLEKWRKSLDLHARYTELTDDQYWLVQPWPQHQRPNRWIVDLASQRLAELQRVFQSRVASGDPSLSEALELMLFLANLVGSQHVQRYIPMAEPEQQRPIESLTVQQGRAAAPPPGPVPAVNPPAPAAPEPHRPAPQRVDARDLGPAIPVAQPESLRSPPEAPAPKSREEDVVRDAVRLLSWGREWHELPHAIARMAGRPDSATVRQILRAQREIIEQRASERAAAH